MEHYYLATQYRWKCKACKRQFSIKVGSIFEDSPLPLDKWLVAMWMIANCKNGISSYELARDLKITQESAWSCSREYGRPCKTKSFGKKLCGEIEADETFIGGKAIVAAVLERHEEIRATVVEKRRKPQLQSLVRENVASGPTD